MRLNKTTAWVLLCVLNGQASAAAVARTLPAVNLRSIQRALVRLHQLGLINKWGSNNNPSYFPNYPAILDLSVDQRFLENTGRPVSRFHHGLIGWLKDLPQPELNQLSGGLQIAGGQAMTAKELEQLTIELSWKSSALEGNTYTLLDTQLLLNQGIKAKNRTDFETQMILNHKNAVTFITLNPELFGNELRLSTIEELHKIIGFNLGIASGIRKKNVGVTASNYQPLENPHQLRENANTVLKVISRTSDPFTKSLLAMALIPYLQLFEDGNKRTGRLLANGLMIHNAGRGFSLRQTDARQLALGYLAFYEFNSLKALVDLLQAEL